MNKELILSVGITMLVVAITYITVVVIAVHVINEAVTNAPYQYPDIVSILINGILVGVIVGVIGIVIFYTRSNDFVDYRR